MPVHKEALSRNTLLCIFTVAVFFSPFTRASAQEAITTSILTSTPNFRDLAGISASNGGTGFADTTGNGGAMRTGVIYRSDYLSLNPADWNTISTLGIRRDIDLRTPSEYQANPDWVPRGATYTNINIYGTNSPVPPSPFAASPTVAGDFMRAGYREFVTTGVQRDGFRTVLLTLANDSNASLYHCSGGKDRTGWTSMILQSIAGVPQATIMLDYLATNTYTATLVAAAKATLLLANPTWDPLTIDALLGVRSSYLQAGLDQVTTTYGSMYAYLTQAQGLGLTQADIYVLRARMVYYSVLPGQGGFSGNAAQGAALLNALQNSPLSGHYTNFNYYLQSAIDAGSLGGVETQIGGQIHADAVSFLMRRPRWIDEAVAPYTSGRDLRAGQVLFWTAGLGGTFRSDGRAGIGSSTENSAGSLVGVTHRFSNQAVGNFGIGYNWGSVRSSDASATLNTILGTIGGRYGFSSLETGPYALARADIGWVDYQSSRTLGGGLGNPSGQTHGAFYSGLAGVGNDISLAPFTFRVQTGLRITYANLGSFQERGEVGLDVNSIDKVYTSALLDLDIGLDRQKVGAWTITPALTLGYERLLNDPKVTSTGAIYGFSVNQYSAFNSQNLIRAGLGITAQRNAFIIKAGVNGIVTDGADSTGISGQLSMGYSF